MRVESDVTRAHTLPTDFYRDERLFQWLKDSLFARSWQFVMDTGNLKTPGNVVPFELLPGCLNEPLLLTRNFDDKLHCLSNVCTHRGNLLVEGSCHTQSMRCRYHGRRFALDGSFGSAPGFESAKNFPTGQDDLATVPFALWKNLIFACAAREPLFPFQQLFQPIQRRLDWLPLENFSLDEHTSREYLVRANWALYCENYLEGFHIPYVHPELASSLDIRQYRTEVFELATVQIGVASSPAESFELPESSPDYGAEIGAYYFWLFPNIMMNFYPWGLSLNIVIPLELERTKVHFLNYVWDERKRSIGAGSAIDRVERQDEDIVEKVQKGVKSRFYRRGRYSPEWERGVHQFHRLLERYTVEYRDQQRSQHNH